MQTSCREQPAVMTMCLRIGWTLLLERLRRMCPQRLPPAGGSTRRRRQGCTRSSSLQVRSRTVQGVRLMQYMQVRLLVVIEHSVHGWSD